MAMYQDNEGTQAQSSGGGSFVIGVLAGTAIGVGIGMLLAPKSGAELREQLSGRASDLADKASRQYKRAASAASDLADRGRDLADRGREAYGSAREAVSRGAQEAQRYVRDTANTVSDTVSEMEAQSSRGSRS